MEKIDYKKLKEEIDALPVLEIEEVQCYNPCFKCEYRNKPECKGTKKCSKWK